MASIFKINHSVTGSVLGLSATTPTGDSYRVMSVTASINNTPTTNENFTITLNANAGPEYDTLFYTLDPAATTTTDIVWYPDGWEWLLEGGDAVNVAFANSDANRVAVQVTLKRIL